jgi:hypothetical protein
MPPGNLWLFTVFCEGCLCTSHSGPDAYLLSTTTKMVFVPRPLCLDPLPQYPDSHLQLDASPGTWAPGSLPKEMMPLLREV